MKQLLLLLCALLITSISYSQDNFKKKRLAVESFSYARNINSGYAESVRNRVISSIKDLNRVTLIDLEASSSLQTEAERRATEAAMNDEVARTSTMKTLGADYILNGNVSSLTVNRTYNKETHEYRYTSVLTFELNITNASDGSLFGSEAFRFGGIVSSKNETDAINKNFDLIDNSMFKFINKYYVLDGSIVEIGEQKNNKLKSCYVSLGSAHGVAESHYLVVCKVKTIAGEKIKEEIGQMKITEVLSKNLSNCKVIKGGEEIFKVFSSGEELYISTMAKKAFTISGLTF